MLCLTAHRYGFQKSASTGASLMVCLTCRYKNFQGALPHTAVNPTCTGCGSSFFHPDGTASRYTFEGMSAPFAQSVAGRLRRGPSAILPPSFSFIWRIPIRVTNSSNE